MWLATMIDSSTSVRYAMTGFKVRCCTMNNEGQKNVVLEFNRVQVRPLPGYPLSVICIESQLQTSLQLSNKLSLILS